MGPDPPRCSKMVVVNAESLCCTKRVVVVAVMGANPRHSKRVDLEVVVLTADPPGCSNRVVVVVGKMADPRRCSKRVAVVAVAKQPCCSK